MKRLLDVYYRLLRVALMLLMGLMILPVLIQIVSRHTGLIPRYIWTEESARFCFIWLIMVGSMIAVRDGTHFVVDLLPASETPRQQAVGRIVVHGAMLLMALVFTWYGIGFARFGWIQTSEMSGINMLSIYVAFPLSGLTWTLFLAERLVADLRGMTDHEPGAGE